MNKKDQTKAMVVVGLLLVAVAYYISKRKPEGFMTRGRACSDCREGIEPQDSCPICYGHQPTRSVRRKRHLGRCNVAAKSSRCSQADGICGGRWHQSSQGTCSCPSGMHATGDARWPHLGPGAMKLCRHCGDIPGSSGRDGRGRYISRPYGGRCRQYYTTGRRGWGNRWFGIPTRI